jgi:hypothetical protein
VGGEYYFQFQLDCFVVVVLSSLAEDKMKKENPFSLLLLFPSLITFSTLP